MLESLAANQIEERDRRLELREDIEILFQAQQQSQENWDARQQQTQAAIDAVTAQISALVAQAAADRAIIAADRAQVMADRAAEAQARADFIAQMVGLQTEVRNILRELAEMRRQQGNGTQG
jgi:cytochrome c oxidase assembly protein Cox11